MVTFQNVCRVQTKRQAIIKMLQFNMFITAVCALFLIKLRWPKNSSVYDKALKTQGNARGAQGMLNSQRM